MTTLPMTICMSVIIMIRLSARLSRWMRNEYSRACRRTREYVRNYFALHRKLSLYSFCFQEFVTFTATRALNNRHEYRIEHNIPTTMNSMPVSTAIGPFSRPSA